MSIHPPKTKPAPRSFFVWKGIRIEKKFAQRPRVHRLTATKYEPKR